MNAPPALVDDRNPQVRTGVAAALSQYRIEGVGVGVGEDEELVLLRTPVVSALYRIEEEIQFENVVGIACVTENRFLFVANELEVHDIAVDAECIQLHAEGEDETSIYLQFLPQASADGDDDGDGEMLSMELTMQLESPQYSQSMFDALTRLISLHPVIFDEEENNNHHNDDDGDQFNGFMTAERMGLTNGDHNHQVGDGEATEKDREAMLEHLDNLLVVPPHLEIAEEDGAIDGQFDDADADDDDDDDDGR